MQNDYAWIMEIIKNVVSTVVPAMVALLIKKHCNGTQKFFDICGKTRVKSYSDIAIKEYSIVSFVWIIHAVVMMVLSYFDKLKYVFVIFFVLYFTLAGYWTHENIENYKNIIKFSPHPVVEKGLLWSIYVLWGIFLIIEYIRDFNTLDIVKILFPMVIWAVLVGMRQENIFYTCNHEFFSFYDQSTKQTIKICAQSIEKEGEWIKGKIGNMQGQTIYLKQDNIMQIKPEGGCIAWCEDKKIRNK